MHYDNLKNINENFKDLMDIKGETIPNQIDEDIGNLKQSLEFLTDLLNAYEKEP